MTTLDAGLLNHLRFRCIGPTRGGRVVAVAADPERPAVFYFGGAAGGIWRSDDAGLYWENVSDGFLGTASIGALAVAPSDGNVIYAGTGESTIRIDVTHGDGVYKSTDAARTWTHAGLPHSRHIGKIAVHPRDPDTVLVAALGHMSMDNPDRGLYRSVDGGDNWELVLHVSQRAGAVDVAIDPGNPRVLFATIWQARRTFWSIDSGGPDSGLWRSEDGGNTWEDITRSSGMPTGPLGKIGVAVSPAQTGRVWAIVEAEGRRRGLYRSDDYGHAWTHVSKKPELCWRPWYYMHLTAHPTDPDTVFVMNMKAWKSVDGGANFAEFHTPHGDNHALWVDHRNPDRMIGCDDGGAWVSMNGGGSWSSIYNQMTAQFYHVDVDDQYPYLVYGSQQDNSSIAVPSRTGKGAINWGDCYPPGTAESGYVAVKPGNPDVVYVGAIGSSPGNGDALQRYNRVTDQVQLVSVWPEDAPDAKSAEVRFQWTYPIVFSPHDPNVLYACGNRVYRTADEGHSWEAISPDLSLADPTTMGPSGPLTMDTAGAEMYATIFSFIASAHRPATMMAGSDDGLVHVSHDDGQTWTDVTPDDVPHFSQVTMLEESPHVEGTVYMTIARHKMGDYEPHVYRTRDFGGSWERIVSGLPAGEFCRVIREDPDRPGLLYLGTELGLHVSFDGGDRWQAMGGNLPVTPIYDLKARHGDLIVATHGRSFWILDDRSQLHQLADELDASTNHLFRPPATVRAPKDLFADFWGSKGGKNYHVTIGQNATFYLEEDETGHQHKRVIDAGEDITRGVCIRYWLAEDAGAGATLTILDAAGTEIETFTSDIPAEEDDREGRYITAAAGMNAFQWSMEYPAGPKMSGSDFHGRPNGPLALPGTYRVRLDIGAWSMTQSFELVLDPRVSVERSDLEEQFDLLSRIRDKLSDVVDAVNRIRSIKQQLASWQERMPELEGVGEVIIDLETVEEALVQREFTSEGDSLKHPARLFENLSGLPPIVASADTKPTTQSHAVFEKLSNRIDAKLAELDAVVDGSVAAVNVRLRELGVGERIGIVGA